MSVVGDSLTTRGSGRQTCGGPWCVCVWRACDVLGCADCMCRVWCFVVCSGTAPLPPTPTSRSQASTHPSHQEQHLATRCVLQVTSKHCRASCQQQRVSCLATPSWFGPWSCSQCPWCIGTSLDTVGLQRKLLKTLLTLARFVTGVPVCAAAWWLGQASCGCAGQPAVW